MVGMGTAASTVVPASLEGERMLTGAEHRQFDERGLLRLPAAIARDDVQSMRHRLWQHLEQNYSATPERPDTWPAGALAHFQSLTRTGAFDTLGSKPVREAIDALLGAGTWQEPEHWGRPLVTFPDSAPWQLPSRGWHRDSSDRPGDPVVVLFACLSPVEPHGGGTLVVCGELAGGVGGGVGAGGGAVPGAAHVPAHGGVVVGAGGGAVVRRATTPGA
jgi:hypothetical protein